ncbi:C-5 cytosine-specific DNA methylase [Devosia sp. H5989]|nr:C-5 cytosine-specific DNA methylase [Devosia sp. H5989]
MNKFLPSQNWALDDRMTVVLFAGMGGGCDGLEDAGFHVHLAINHDPLAIAVHEARHPHTTHMRCDVFEVDPRAATRGRGVRVLHASPDCTHFSVAKGSKPVSKRRRSLAWVVIRWAGQVRPEVITLENVREIQTWGPLIAKRDKKTGRVLKLDKTVAAKGERVPVEQQWLVPDPRHKGRIWKAWLKHLAALGYSFDGQVLVCADYGVPTIRKRFFGVAKADGSSIAWPERTHAPRKLARKLKLKPWVGAHTIIDWSLPMKSIFDRKKPLADATLRRIARGVIRYVIDAQDPFIVPITHSGGDRVNSVADPLRTLTTAHRGEMMLISPHVTKFRSGATGSELRESLPTYTANSFEKRPGGAAPLGVAAVHLEKFSENSVGLDPRDPLKTVMAGGQAHAVVAAHLVRTDQASAAARNGIHDPREPINTLHTAGGMAVAAVTMVQTGYGERDGQAPRSLDVGEPVGTQVAGGSKAALVAAFLAQHNADSRRIGGVNPGRDASDPLATLTMQSQVGVGAVTLGRLRGADVAGQDICEPLPTQTCGGGHEMLIMPFLQTYYGSGDNNHSALDPLHTVTAGDRHGLVTVEVDGQTMVITDIMMRMLDWSEGARAHGFEPESLMHEIEVVDSRGRVTRRKPNKTECGHLIGNSVPPRMVRLLAECNARRELVAA